MKPCGDTLRALADPWRKPYGGLSGGNQTERVSATLSSPLIAIRLLLAPDDRQRLFGRLVIRVDAHGGFQFRLGILQVPQTQQSYAENGMQRGIVRFEFERFP